MKQGRIKYHFWVFSMPRPGIESPISQAISEHYTHTLERERERKKDKDKEKEEVMCVV